MTFRKQHLFVFIFVLALALTLGACQQAVPATQEPAAQPTQSTQEEAPAATAAPSPEAQEPAATTQPAKEGDSGFQEVNEPLGKVILPPEAPSTFAAAERPNSTLGQDDATLTMYEWCDYAYPNCLTFYQDVLPDLQSKYVDTGKLRIVHKEFPVAGGDPSVVASMAAQCAADQGKYQEMADWLYNNVQTWSQQTDLDAVKDAMKKAGQEIGIKDQDAFDACVDNDAKLEQVKQDYLDGRDLKFRDLPGFVVDGRVIAQGATADELNTIIDALLQLKETGTLPDTVVTVTPSPTPDLDFEPETVTTLGDPNAPVTIVEFSDYQCPYCLRNFQQTFPKIKENYIDTGKVKYVFKDFPLSFHKQAMPASMAAECAGEQGKYWEMHDKLFSERDRWNENPDVNNVMKDFAKELGLDTKQFNECFDSEKYKDEILADQQEGIAAGVKGTPAFFINGQFLSGAQPYEVFKQVIDQALKNAGQ